MRNSVLLLLTFILVSCASIPEELELSALVAEDKLERLLEEVDNFMSMPVSSPNGKLKTVKNYISTSDFYYLINDSFQYNVITDTNQDTVMITLLYLSGEQVLTKHSLSYQNGEAYRWSTFEYIYNSKGQLDEIYSSNSNMQRALLGKYKYDSKNLLVEIEYPYENGAELHMYEYDESNRIVSEWKSVRGQENNKIDYLVFRYDDGLLVAKESGVRGIISDERQDAFQYFYDPQGKLIFSKEFDPYFGFQEKENLEYFYYEENN